MLTDHLHGAYTTGNRRAGVKSDGQQRRDEKREQRRDEKREERREERREKRREERREERRENACRRTRLTTS